MNARLQQCARHADLSGPKHTASTQHERIAGHSVTYTRKTAADSIDGSTATCSSCVESFADQSLTQLEAFDDDGVDH